MEILWQVRLSCCHRLFTDADLCFRHSVESIDCYDLPSCAAKLYCQAVLAKSQAVLCCAVLCCAVLCCAVLCCGVACRAVAWRAVA